MKQVWQRINGDKDIASLVGTLLRAGVIVSSAIALLGGIMYLYGHGADSPEYTEFTGASENLRHLQGIFEGVLALQGPAIIQLGVVVLLSTPILRIVLSALGFALEKDYLYVAITLVVLAVIVFGMLADLAG